MLLSPFVVVPQSPVSDSFIHITEDALLEKLDQEFSRLLRTNWATSGNGSLWKNLFGDSLGGRFWCCTFNEHNPEGVTGDNKAQKRNRYILLTTICTNGFDLNCLVVDSVKPKQRTPEESGACPLEDAEKKRKRARIPSDLLPNQEQLRKVETVIGVDAGEVFAVGACAKSMASYTVENGVVGQLRTALITNLKIKTKALFEPDRLRKRWLEHEKTEVKS